MSRTSKDSKYAPRRERRLSVKAAHRIRQDFQTWSPTMLRLALAQLAAEKAAAESVDQPVTGASGLEKADV